MGFHYMFLLKKGLVCHYAQEQTQCHRTNSLQNIIPSIDKYLHYISIY